MFYSKIKLRVHSFGTYIPGILTSVCEKEKVCGIPIQNKKVVSRVYNGTAAHYNIMLAQTDKLISLPHTVFILTL